MGTDVIVMSHMTSTFNMVNFNVKEHGLGRLLRYARKRIHHGCSVLIETSVLRDHCLASLSKALKQILLSTPHTHERFVYMYSFTWCYEMD